MSFLLRLVAVAVLLVSLVLMIGPFGGFEASTGVSDKLAHFGVFALILWSFGVLFPRLQRIRAALLAVALGGAVEVVQGMIGRDADLLDLVADAAGILAALALWATWRGFRPRAALQISNTR